MTSFRLGRNYVPDFSPISTIASDPLNRFIRDKLWFHAVLERMTDQGKICMRMFFKRSRDNVNHVQNTVKIPVDETNGARDKMKAQESSRLHWHTESPFTLWRGGGVITTSATNLGSKP